MNEPSAATGHGEQSISFRAALRVWAKIGLLGFGGPAGQIALMHRELVEERRWISESRFLHALNYCMLLPGPEAQQLAIYIGWLLHRTWGGIVAGVLFVLPGALLLAALSAYYIHAGTQPAVAGIFFGLKVAVLAIVVHAVVKIAQRALKTRFLRVLAVAAFVAIFAFRLPFPLIVFGAAIAGIAARHVSEDWLPSLQRESDANSNSYLIDRQLASGSASHLKPSLLRLVAIVVIGLVVWLAPVAGAIMLFGDDHVLAAEGVFFSQAAVVTFGGAYAVLAYVAQRAVEDFGWLQPNQMLDGLALAETTPGPLILVLQFVGFVAAYGHPGSLNPWLAAFLGAALTTWTTFVPSFLFIFAGAPYIESLRRQRNLHAALSAITAAVVGVILNLSIWFGLHLLFGTIRTTQFGAIQLQIPDWSTLDGAAAMLTIVALLATLRWKLGLGWVLLGCASAGLAIWGLRHGFVSG